MNGLGCESNYLALVDSLSLDHDEDWDGVVVLVNSVMTVSAASINVTSKYCLRPAVTTLSCQHIAD